MFARVVSFQGKPGQADAGIRNFRDEVIPQLRTMSGFKGAQLLIDRKTGKAMVVALWDSEKDLQASNTATAKLRAQAAQVVGAAHPPTVEVYEAAASVSA